MKLRIDIAMPTVMILSIATALASNQMSLGQESAKRRACVLAELFTSEGCSSCPPADQVLRTLQNLQPISGVHIITLGEHVSYWNYLGWQDPFSSDLFTQRQYQYASLFQNSSVYTPQMIVDGHSEFAGNDYAKAISVIRDAANRSKVDIIVDVQSSTNDKLVAKGEVKWTATHEAQTAAFLVALVEDNLHSSVIRGENSGRTLDHSSVVRELIDIKDLLKPSGAFDITITIKPLWKKQNLRVVVFAQNPTTGQILGVGESGMNN